ncbi:hypothetical protein MMC19_007781 [Ptychographa xylographoides]|nr:hypothetical protein [Ptychographa xylographoides]
MADTPPPDTSHAHSRPAGAAGNGLFAAKAFVAGDLVLRVEREVLSVIDSPALTTTASWKHHHKYECKVFKRLYPNVLPNTVRLLLRILLRRQNGVLPEYEWEAFMRLQHHLDDFKRQRDSDSQTTWENIQLMARAAKEYSGSKDELGRIEGMMGRVLINALTLVTPTFTPLGLSLSPTTSLLNHSCLPNTCITFSGPTLSLRALRPIAKDAELSISYIDITNPAATRQADLLSRYFFTCACVCCTASPPLTLNRIDPPLSLAASLSPITLSALEGRARELMQASLDPGPDLSARLQPLSEAMSLFTPHAAYYPPYRQPFAALRAELVLVLLATSQYVPALIHTLITYFHIDPFLFPEAVHPVRVVHKLVLLKLVLEVAHRGADGDKAVTELAATWALNWGVVAFGLSRELDGSIAGSHGAEGRFAQQVRTEVSRFMVDSKAGLFRELGSGGRSVVDEWGRLRKVADQGLAWWEARGR